MANEIQLVDIEALSHFKTKQDLANEQKFQKKTDTTDLKGAVRYDSAQVLEETQKDQARQNIGVAPATAVIRVDIAQELTDEQKAQARANIGAGTSDVTESGEGAVRFDVQQALDEEDKARARANIGAGTSNFDGDYNSLTNRTHYREGIEIIWNGDCSGKEKVIYDDSEYCMCHIKVSDNPLSDISGYIGATLTMVVVESVEHIVLTEELFTRYSDNIQFMTFDNVPALINVINPETVQIGDTQMAFASAGVYFMASYLNSSETQAISYVQSVSSVVYHKLADEFIPDSIPRLDESGKLSTEIMPDLGFYDEIIEGYFNSSDNLFYEEAEFATAIVGESGKIYVDMTENNSYRYSGTIFVRINPPEYTVATNSDIEALFTS